ncbi:ribosomal protein S18 acetylase RimI-like enzyme [Pseudarthrobacter sp. PvP004]|uniref:GNAT family N-acetyltransferase n=1 Tax=Pseudarthrobacter sp. PvP004 TaxID=2817850 RepID=UPI001AE4FA9F|nr:GNAT family N-acetyltransferase [Pseudarthrobacter sp. PvP004]MBP2269154.1 ribosomal protein S18 acetylase RimI-like enzyme [Pseudarthrobacter sp. PvP004]
MTNPHIRLATSDDLDLAATTLAAAFHDYPWTQWVIPETNYAKRLHDLQRLYLDYAYQHGKVLVTVDFVGIAALLPADAPSPDEEFVGRILELHGERVNRIQQKETSPGSWTLETLGVHPQSQGLGIGSRLVGRAAAEAVTADAEALVLETSDCRNVRLYERHGFRVVEHSAGGEGPDLWAMRLSIKSSKSVQATPGEDPSQV